MKILVTGSTGLVGTALTQSLKSTEHTVCRLIRPGTAAEWAALLSGRTPR
jgi:NAD dependent epimerase/dehydratase family enzyme